MLAVFGRSRPSTRPSVSRRDLIPELGIAVAAVGLTGVVHAVITLRLGQNPLFLFLLTAAALTFWRGLGPGMLASHSVRRLVRHSMTFRSMRSRRTGEAFRSRPC